MKRILVALAVLGGAAAAAVLLLALSTFPRESGTVKVAGVAAPVTIETDAHGVPTIRAASAADALFGLGYAHARDRLWQIEYQRRIGTGRLAEILGPRLVETDRFLRTIGFRRAAESAWRALPPEERRLLEAYTRGLNAYLASSSARPIEFRILRCPVSAFDPVDSLTWAKLMAWDLAGNARNEIRRARFVAAVGEKRAAELLPPVPETPTILEDEEWQRDFPLSAARGEGQGEGRGSATALPSSFLSRLDRAFALAGARDPDSVLGSNSWVLAGSRTTSGKPILANDPHLGLRTPSVWYLARLSAPRYSVVGATLPGVAGVVIGANDRIAWALTSLEPDVQDLYVEEVDPADPSRYLWRGSSRAFETRRETIRVRGRPDVVFDVRRSVHGPIVTDVLDGAALLGPAVALRWTALDDTDSTAEAIEGINRASSWTEFLEAVRRFHAPAQNFLYADADGHIGYTASGAIPIRPRADGLAPVSGSGEDDWTGYVPFDELPRVLDPARGFLVAANNRVASARYPYEITADWPEPYRARRIAERILAKEKLGVSDVESIQLDRVSLQAIELLPLLLSTAPADAGSRDAIARLSSWNREFAPDSAAAAIYAAWYSGLAKMPEDELGATPLGAIRSRFLIEALSSESAWCDDVRTSARETCAEFRTRTLRKGVSLLSRRLGADPREWRWERLHRARFPHGIFDAVAGLRALFSLEAGQGGDASTVNVGAYGLDGSFRMTDGPSYRQIVDFADRARSLFVHTTGQSGNVFDRRYRDLLPLWRRGVYFRIGETPRKLLRLVPR
ncbi:MAG TPA: penicillin acylase family protein [Thermoanaerobaculia bacterium]|nr:penicillin acylase family protein [Thermoanaerobaculia bacterium]